MPCQTDISGFPGERGARNVSDGVAEIVCVVSLDNRSRDMQARDLNASEKIPRRCVVNSRPRRCRHACRRFPRRLGGKWKHFVRRWSRGIAKRRSYRSGSIAIVQQRVEPAALLSLEEICFRLDVRKPTEGEHRNDPANSFGEFLDWVRTFRSRTRPDFIPSEVYGCPRSIRLVIHGKCLRDSLAITGAKIPALARSIDASAEVRK